MRARLACYRAFAPTPPSWSILPGLKKAVMVSWSLRSLVLGLGLSAQALGVLGARVQAPSITLPREAAQRRQDLKNIFLTSWNAYKYVGCRIGRNDRA